MDLISIIKANNNSLDVKVIPGSSLNKIKIVETDNIFQVRIYVTDPPEDGKANSKVIKLLAKELKTPKSNINIIKGFKSREKRLVIDL